MSVTASMVKELRSLTGAGMSDCKKALVENEGDIESAVGWLRARGAALAERKADREASEGKIVVATNENTAVLVEIRAETDFVANNQLFIEFANKVAQAALAENNETVELANLQTSEGSVEELRTQATLQIGENIQLGRCSLFSANHTLASYVHHDGKIGVVADVEGLNEEQSKQICMHIASMKPLGLDRNSLNQEELEKQREFFAAEVASSGKPEEIQKKMVEGKLSKYVAEQALLEQEYVWEDKLSVGKFLENNNANLHAYNLLFLGQ